jgi:hypothetical protein
VKAKRSKRKDVITTTEQQLSQTLTANLVAIGRFQVEIARLTKAAEEVQMKLRALRELREPRDQRFP